jgi:lysozyme
VPTIKEQLELHEGNRRFPYEDTVGKLTIGIGHNLTDNGLSETARNFIFWEDLAVVERELAQNFDWYARLDSIRKRVLIDMCFNLGITRLLGFRVTLTLVKHGRYEDAATQMLKSLWAKQVGQRAQRLAEMMASGKDYTR